MAAKIPRQHDGDLKPLSGKKCYLKVARETLQLREVIGVLGKMDNGFWNNFSNDIITGDIRDQITNAKTSSEVLGLIRKALNNSLDPKKLDEVIQVLREKQSNSLADSLEEHYHEMIRKHTCSAECVERKG